MKITLIKSLKKKYGSADVILETPYVHREIDKEYVIENLGKARGNVRVNAGLFDTIAESEKWRDKIRALELP